MAYLHVFQVQLLEKLRIESAVWSISKNPHTAKAPLLFDKSMVSAILKVIDVIKSVNETCFTLRGIMPFGIQISLGRNRPRHLFSVIFFHDIVNLYLQKRER